MPVSMKATAVVLKTPRDPRLDIQTEIPTKRKRGRPSREEAQKRAKALADELVVDHTTRAASVQAKFAIHNTFV